MKRFNESTIGLMVAAAVLALVVFHVVTTHDGEAADPVGVEQAE